MSKISAALLLLFVVVASCATIVALDISLAFCEAYVKISVEYEERKRWYDTHGSESGEFTFLADVIRETREIIAVGPVLAAVKYAFRNNALATLAEQTWHFAGRFFLAQMLFPTTVAQKALLVGLCGIVLWIVLAYLTSLKRLDIIGTRVKGREAARSAEALGLDVD